MQHRTLLPLLRSAVLDATRLPADERLPPRAAGNSTLASGPIEVRATGPGPCRTPRLVSDRQPRRLLADDHSTGPLYVWLHYDGAPLTWIVVDIGPSDCPPLAVCALREVIAGNRLI